MHYVVGKHIVLSAKGYAVEGAVSELAAGYEIALARYMIAAFKHIGGISRGIEMVGEQHPAILYPAILRLRKGYAAAVKAQALKVYKPRILCLYRL